ncbi:MAG: hypothetical protein BWY83_02454 [bacterium ADurb.Bin478]|nr:MAG: hypothetical protein BWY83_02454 [bacterium ADurb.Bin478]
MRRNRIRIDLQSLPIRGQSFFLQPALDVIIPLNQPYIFGSFIQRHRLLQKSIRLVQPRLFNADLRQQRQRVRIARIKLQGLPTITLGRLQGIELQSESAPAKAALRAHDPALPPLLALLVKHGEPFIGIRLLRLQGHRFLKSPFSQLILVHGQIAFAEIEIDRSILSRDTAGRVASGEQIEIRMIPARLFTQVPRGHIVRIAFERLLKGLQGWTDLLSGIIGISQFIVADGHS